MIAQILYGITNDTTALFVIAGIAIVFGGLLWWSLRKEFSERQEEAADIEAVERWQPPRY